MSGDTIHIRDYPRIYYLQKEVRDDGFDVHTPVAALQSHVTEMRRARHCAVKE